MASLKETKERIGSVKSTLKITSAMKLVSSAKLHKFSTMAQPLKDYRTELEQCLNELGPAPATAASNGPACIDAPATDSAAGKTLLIAFSANSSLCGGYNAFIIKKAREIILPDRQNFDCIFIGKKIKESMARLGIRSLRDLDHLIDHPDYATCSELAEQVLEKFNAGEYSGVKILYTHYISTARQEIICEDLLPFTVQTEDSTEAENAEDLEKRLILEPGQALIRAAIQDKLLKIKVYGALMDSCLSEHAARTVAMQTATDNAHNMLDELTLEYNKGRQAKITSEILDLAGGALE
jgi:F-type H+-transporting ATPase subunit gamma